MEAAPRDQLDGVEPPQVGEESLRLRRGERLTVRHLLLGLLLKSANDAGVALAEAVDGSEAAFVRRMNRKAAALGLMLAVPEPVALYAGCVLFGLSVGNIITLPALIIQREFAARSFGLVLGLSTALAQVTFACGPALLGAIRDAAGSHAPALALCIALQTSASVLILVGRPRR